MSFRRFAVLPMLAVCALSACYGASVPALPDSPAAVANETALDERAAIGAELAYEAFRTAAELAVDAGLLRGETASRVAALDNRAYQALAVARAAYDAGNAETYASALGNANSAVAEALALLKGSRP